MDSCKQAQKMISSAKVFMLMKLPFFGVLVSKLKDIPNDAVDTIATDGVNLYYNPDFVINKLKTREKVIFVLLHEILHIIFGHLYRRGTKDLEKWNIACDYAVNGAIYLYQQSLSSNKVYFQIEPSALFEYAYLNKSAEEIYLLLNQKSKDTSSSNATGDFNQKLLDNHDKWISKNDKETEELQWGIFVKSVLQNIKSSQGAILGCIAVHIDNLFSPKKSWKQELSDFIEPLEKDYGFSPPDRRFMLYDFFMPSEYLYGEDLKNVYFYVDCSGSVDDELIKEFVSEVVGCYSQFSSKSEIYFGTFDTEASNPVFLSDNYVLDVKGGGGTDPASVFHKLDQLHLLDEAKLIIILTDGYFSSMLKSIAKDVPVLWVISQYGTGDNIKDSGWDNIIYL